MKRIIIIYVLILSIFLCGCSRTYNWEFRKDSSEAIQVSIIYSEYTLHSAEEIINLPPIKIVEVININELYDDVLNLKMKTIFHMEPLRPFGYCILICYDNDEYCILSTEGSGYIYYNEKYESLSYRSIDLVFNKEDFLNIVNKYLKD